MKYALDTTFWKKAGKAGKRIKFPAGYPAFPGFLLFENPAFSPATRLTTLQNTDSTENVRPQKMICFFHDRAVRLGSTQLL
jgi:hypothetical protein